MIESKEKCINPWFGFLVIVVVCVLIASAIFFEFKGQRRHGGRGLRPAPKKAATPVVYPNPAVDAQTTQDKVLF